MAVSPTHLPPFDCPSGRTRRRIRTCRLCHHGRRAASFRGLRVHCKLPSTSVSSHLPRLAALHCLHLLSSTALLLPLVLPPTSTRTALYCASSPRVSLRLAQCVSRFSHGCEHNGHHRYCGPTRRLPASDRSALHRDGEHSTCHHHTGAAPVTVRGAAGQRRLVVRRPRGRLAVPGVGPRLRRGDGRRGGGGGVRGADAAPARALPCRLQQRVSPARCPVHRTALSLCVSQQQQRDASACLRLCCLCAAW